MTEQTSKPSPKAAREARLKQALRENLKRRKAQSRERSETSAKDGASGVAASRPDDTKR